MLFHFSVSNGRSFDVFCRFKPVREAVVICRVVVPRSSGFHGHQIGFLRFIRWRSDRPSVNPWRKSYRKPNIRLETETLQPGRPLIRSNFIKTTYDISLDSQISLLPLGFSLSNFDSNWKWVRSETCSVEPNGEPTWRCHQNPFIGALGIQEPVIPGEPLIKG